MAINTRYRNGLRKPGNSLAGLPNMVEITASGWRPELRGQGWASQSLKVLTRPRRYGAGSDTAWPSVFTMALTGSPLPIAWQNARKNVVNSCMIWSGDLVIGHG